MSSLAVNGERAGHEIFAQARAHLTLEVPAGLTDPTIIPQRGDHDVDPVMRAIAEVRPVRPAAVLVPIVAREAPTVLLTQRSAHLPDHPGQIAFPGGKIDAGDESPLAAALREAEEEIGLDAAFRRADRLSRPLYDDARLSHRSDRRPRGARLSPGRSIASEVDDAFEVPLAFLMAEENHKLHSREWKGIDADRLRDAVRRALDLGRHRGHPAQPVRTHLYG